MTIENLKILIADEGKWLTKDGVFSKKVYLGTLDKADNWQEVSDAEKEAAEKEAEAAAQAAAATESEPAA